MAHLVLISSDFLVRVFGASTMRATESIPRQVVVTLRNTDVYIAGGVAHRYHTKLTVCANTMRRMLMPTSDRRESLEFGQVWRKRHVLLSHVCIIMCLSSISPSFHHQYLFPSSAVLLGSVASKLKKKKKEVLLVSFFFLSFENNMQLVLTMILCSATWNGRLLLHAFVQLTRTVSSV